MVMADSFCVPLCARCYALLSMAMVGHFIVVSFLFAIIHTLNCSNIGAWMSLKCSHWWVFFCLCVLVQWPFPGKLKQYFLVFTVGYGRTFRIKCGSDCCEFKLHAVGAKWQEIPWLAAIWLRPAFFFGKKSNWSISCALMTFLNTKAWHDAWMENASIYIEHLTRASGSIGG